MKVIEAIVKSNNSLNYSLDILFTENTTEDSEVCLNCVKEKLYEVIKLLLFKNYILFKDIKTMEFYISQDKDPKPKKNMFKLNTYFIEYTKDVYNEVNVNYYWGKPFNKFISSQIIGLMESSEHSLKNSIPYNYNTIKFKIESSIEN